MSADSTEPNARASAPWPVWALGVFAILLVAFFFRAMPLELDPVRKANAPDQFDATRAIERLGHVLDGTPHPVDSAALDETRARLLREIIAMGYTPELRAHNTCQSQFGGGARCGFVQNVFFTAGPQVGPALLLTAHYDSVEASPGFGDDGIGVAVWLEVAHLLKQTPPSKPVVFLLTDGEEAGLLGAQAYVDNQKDYPFTIGRIINLEARGVRGPALMFQTGRPNANVVSDWSASGARPFANSMMAAIYDLLPNDTDLTPHLANGSNGVNIAIGDGFDFYHTNHDDLAHLDPASVQHMGDQALGATRAFLAADWSSDKTVGDIAYSDIGSRLFVALPQVFALVLLGLCFGMAGMLLVRPSREGGWEKLDFRAFAFPLVYVVAAGLATFALGFVMTALRPEPGFWTAVPQAFNLAIFALTLLIGAAGLAWFAPNARRELLFASGWFWFLSVGMGLSIAIAGFSMYFLIPGIVFVLAGGASWLFPRYRMIAYAAAGAVLVLMFFPLLYLLDVMLGLGMPAMFGIVAALVLAPLLAIVGGIASGKLKAILPLAAVFVAAVGVTKLAPAYTQERPLHLSLVAHYDAETSKAAVFASAPAGALPKVIADELKVGATPPIPGSRGGAASKTIAFTPPGLASANLLSDTTAADGKRALRLQLAGPGAHVISLRIPEEAKPVSVGFGGRTYDLHPNPLRPGYVIDVVGRASNGATIDVTLAAPPQGAKPKAGEWLVQGTWLQLPDDVKALAQARPDNTVRYQMGDVSITTIKLKP